MWDRLRLARTRSVELPEGYRLEEVGKNLLLRRPNGYVLAAFGEGAKLDNIRRVAEADDKYLRAVEREEKFGIAADSETVLLFAEDVKGARTELLMALEAAYRG